MGGGGETPARPSKKNKTTSVRTRKSLYIKHDHFDILPEAWRLQRNSNKENQKFFAVSDPHSEGGNMADNGGRPPVDAVELHPQPVAVERLVHGGELVPHQHVERQEVHVHLVPTGTHWAGFRLGFGPGFAPPPIHP